MIIENNISKLFSDLIKNKIAEISISGSDLKLKIMDSAQTFSLSSLVYWGGNYLPKSVKACLKKKPVFDEGIISTVLMIDEENFEITLYYQENTSELCLENFTKLIEEFVFLANEWRDLLDEQDKNDLVHVRT